MRIEELAGMGSNPKVEVGTKCTLHFYSDSHPAEVVKVSPSGKTCWIRRNEVIADKTKDGGMGHQNWIFKEGDFMKVKHNAITFEDYDEPTLVDKPDNYTFYKVTFRKDGRWRTTGSDIYVAMNQWHNYYDWSF